MARGGELDPREVFFLACAEAFRDGQVEAEENALLKALAGNLGLDREVATAIARKARAKAAEKGVRPGALSIEELYGKVCVLAHRKGGLGEPTRALLARVAEGCGLDPDRANELLEAATPKAPPSKAPSPEAPAPEPPVPTPPVPEAAAAAPPAPEAPAPAPPTPEAPPSPPASAVDWKARGLLGLEWLALAAVLALHLYATISNLVAGTEVGLVCAVSLVAALGISWVAVPRLGPGSTAMPAFSLLCVPAAVAAVWFGDPNEHLGFQLAGWGTGFWANILCLGTIVGMLGWIATRDLPRGVRAVLAIPFLYGSLGFLLGAIHGAPLDLAILGIRPLHRIPFVAQPASIYLNGVLPVAILAVAALAAKALLARDGAAAARRAGVLVFLLVPFLMGTAVMNRYLIPNLSFLVFGREIGAGRAVVRYTSTWDRAEDGSYEHEVEVRTRGFRPGDTPTYEMTVTVQPPAKDGDPLGLTVAVRDPARGSDVLNLERADFEVLEDGVLQDHGFDSLVAREGDDWLRTHLAVCLDVSGSMSRHMDDLRTATRSFVEKLAGYETLMIPFSSRPEPDPGGFTSERDRLVAIAEGLTNGGGTKINDAVWVGLDAFQEKGEGRRVVVVFSDGEDGGSDHDEDTTIERLRGAGAQVFTIGFGTKMAGSRGEDALKRLAEETGGQYFLASDPAEIGEAFQKVFSLLSCQYSLGYVKKRPPPPTLAILEPSEGARLTGDFRVRAEVDREVLRVELLVAGIPLALRDTAVEGAFDLGTHSTRDLPAGPRKIQVRAWDRFDRLVEDEVEVEIVRALPVVEIEAPGDGAVIWEDGEYRAVVTGAPYTRGTFLVDGVARDEFPAEAVDPKRLAYRVEDLGAGAHTLEVRAAVDTGEFASSRVSFKVVDPVPEVRFLFPSDGAELFGEVPVLLAAASGHPEVPLERVALRTGGAAHALPAAGPHRFLWDTSRQAEGEVELVAEVTNAAGRRAEARRRITIIRPEFRVAFAHLATGQVITGSTHVVPRVVETHPIAEVSRVELLVDGKSVEAADRAPGRFETDLVKLAPGRRVLVLVATRDDGVEVRATVEVEVRPPRRVELFVTARRPTGKPLLPSELEGLPLRVREDDAECVDVQVEPAAAVPVLFGLVIDASGSMGEDGKMEAARRAAETFVGRLKSNDRAFLVDFSDHPRLVQEPTYDRRRLVAQISTLRPRNATALWDGVDMAVDRASRDPGRAALVVLSDGVDQNAAGTGPGSQVTLQEVAAAAREGQVQVFPIGLGGALRQGGGRGERALQALARATGGAYAFAPSTRELRKLFQQVMREVSGQAKVSCAPPSGGNDGRWHRMTLEVPGQDLRFTHPPGYLAR